MNVGFKYRSMFTHEGKESELLFTVNLSFFPALCFRAEVGGKKLEIGTE